MNAIVSFLLPASIVSGAAALALWLCSRAPARIRLTVAAIGLLAWAIPWPAVVLPSQWVLVPQTLSMPLMDRLIARQSPSVEAIDADQRKGLAAALSIDYQPHRWLLALALLPGSLIFVIDLLRHRGTLRRWRNESVSGEDLRTLLPESLSRRPHEIRRVSISGIGAATGLRRRTIWIGADIARHPDVRAALVHEALHLKHHDGITLAMVTLIDRIWLWNPIVQYFARQIRFLVEVRCDEACAKVLGRKAYRRSLARLILDLRLVNELTLAPMMSANSNMARILALQHAPRSTRKAWLAIPCCIAGVGAAGLLNAQSVPDVRLGVWEEQRTSTHFDSLRRVLERGPDGKTRMTINAKLNAVNRVHVDFHCDGQSYPFVNSKSNPTGLRYTCRQSGVNSIESRLSSGKSTPADETRVTETVSTDGSRLTMVIVRSGTDGKIETTRRDFARARSD